MNEDMTTPQDLNRLSPAEAAAELAQREQKRMSRRQAFARIGFTAGAAIVASLSADDLFRAVGREMQQNAGDNKVAQKIAKQFSNAGVAVAAGGSSGRPACSDCAGTGGKCGSNYCELRLGCERYPRISTGYTQCLTDAKNFYDNCKDSGCTDHAVDCACPAGYP